MICAYMHPTFEKMLQRIDNMKPAMRALVRAIVIAGAPGAEAGGRGGKGRWCCLGAAALLGPERLPQMCMQSLQVRGPVACLGHCALASLRTAHSSATSPAPPLQ